MYIYTQTHTNVMTRKLTCTWLRWSHQSDQALTTLSVHIEKHIIRHTDKNFGMPKIAYSFGTLNHSRSYQSRNLDAGLLNRSKLS